MKRSFRRLALVLVLTVGLGTLPAATAVRAAGPQIENLTSPTHPDPTGWYRGNDVTFAWGAVVWPVGSCGLPDHASDVAVAGSHVYVAAATGGLQVVDVSDPAAPVVAGSCPVLDSACGVTVAGDYAFVVGAWRVAFYRGGLQVVDVSDPAAPVVVGSRSFESSALAVAVAGSHAYVAEWGDDNGVLEVVDVSDPAAPVVVGSCVLPSNAVAVAVAGDHAYVAVLDKGLQVVDVSDPAAPFIAGSWSPRIIAQGVAVAGDHAYVAALDKGLQVVDVSDPAAPVSASSCALPHEARNVAVVGDLAYVADGFGGLRVVDVSDPAAPALLRSCDTPDEALDVAVEGTHAYVCERGDTEAGDNYGTLQVVDLEVYEGLAYSYSFDRSPSEAPDMVVDTSEATLTLADVADGTWYFHIRAVGPLSAWGSAAHRSVNIDTRKPVTKAPYAASVAAGRTATLKYQVTDPRPGSPKATVMIKIKTLSGTSVKTLKLGRVPVGKLLSARFSCKLTKKTYRFYVYATDLAGNAQATVGSNRFTVR